MRVIITLTSISSRMSLLRYTLLSLTNQSYKADKLFLYLSRDAYLLDKGVSSLPVWLEEMVKDGWIEVKWVENTGPYRKLIPLLREDGEDVIIVTADDDIIYGELWLESLLKDFNPDCKVIHAARVRRKIKNILGFYSGYVFWPIIRKPVFIDENWVITFGGGAVFCKSWFMRGIVYDDSYLDVAPTADDLWYSKMACLSGVKVKVIPESLNELHFIDNDGGLFYSNSVRSGDGKFWFLMKSVKYVLNYFNVVRLGNDRAYGNVNKYFRGERL